MPGFLRVLRGLRALVLAVLLAPHARAQATRLVDPLDPVYIDVDRLAAAGLLRTYGAGKRPQSRDQIARWLKEAEATLAGTGASSGRPLGGNLRGFLAEIIERARDRIGVRGDSTSGAQAVARSASFPSVVSLDVTGTNSPTREVPNSNGLGEIRALINPLLANRQGRRAGRGTSALLETRHELESDHLAVVVVPQLSMESDAGSPHWNGGLQELQLRVLFGNAAIDVGREYLIWGQGRHGGLLGSENAPPLDQVRLTTERAFRPPWIFHHLGPTTLSLFYADLGAKQNFPHAYLVGYKATVSPWRPLELGATVYTKSGGRGSPPASISARILDAIPFLDANFFGGKFGTRGYFQFSDRYAGLDGRLRVPSAVGAQLYGEVLLNDFDVRRITSVLWEDAGHVLGLSLPFLLDGGRLGATLELHHTGIRYYEHEQFTSGQTVRGLLVGDPLGPDAAAAYAAVDWDVSSRQRLSVEGAFERRSNDQYAFLTPPAFGFRVTEVRPKEERTRLLATWRTRPQQGRFGFLAQLGYERAQNFAFVAGARKNAMLGRLSLEFRLR